MYLRAINLILVFTVVVSVSDIFKNVSAEVSTLTPAEEKAVVKLRPLVEEQLYKKYMKEDVYLVRFLRARNLNVQNAADMLLKSVAWRKENKMDDIVNEVVGVEKSAPYTVGSFDRSHRPIAVLRIGKWKIRRIVLAGEMDKMVRVIYKFQEQLAQRVIQSAQVHGKNITQGYVILDLSNFNTRDHACLSCTPVSLQLFNSYENYYPQGLKKIVGINVPRLFESIWAVLRPVMSESTKNSVHFYGHDKATWREVLRKDIADDQLPVYLGGTYVENPELKFNAV